jgi:uncharacterized protein YdeI (YjbR/CyaY-like superfamily)
MNREVDAYIERSEKWPAEMARLRPILLDAGLDEQIKWRSPCFTHNGKNIAIFQEMNDFLSLMFFKGALMEDPEGVLVEQGPNSRSARRFEFTSVVDVDRLAQVISAYVTEAIDVAEAGLEVGPPPELELVAELQAALDSDAALAEAFARLTPGRQREYNMHIAGAKQPKTRVARAEKLAPRILEGKGLRDR